jgi:nucleosome-remodeling factor subunit BPTF
MKFTRSAAQKSQLQQQQQQQQQQQEPVIEQQPVEQDKSKTHAKLTKQQQQQQQTTPDSRRKTPKQQSKQQQQQQQSEQEQEQPRQRTKSGRRSTSHKTTHAQAAASGAKKEQNTSRTQRPNSAKKSTKSRKAKYCSDSDDDYNRHYFNEDDDDDVDYYYDDDDDEYVEPAKKKTTTANTTSTSALDLDYVCDDDDNVDVDNFDLTVHDDLSQSSIAMRTNANSPPVSEEDLYDFESSQDSHVLDEVKLPQSSDDLLINKESLLNCLAVYEILRHFRNILRLSPFLCEDFCACLTTTENNALYSEVHVALIRALLKEDEANQVCLGPADLKTCIDLSIFLLDHFTWPDILRQYIESDTKLSHTTNKALLAILNKDAYPLVSVDDKLYVLNALCNIFLASLVARNDLACEGNIVSDDNCRVCHKLGNLLCCETCPATFHLDCLDPPLLNVPEEDWICSICKVHQVGVLFI